MALGSAEIISLVGVLVAAGGVAAAFGYVRSSVGAAHHRVTELAADLAAAEQRLQAQIEANRYRFETHEGGGQDIRERLARIETMLQFLTKGKLFDGTL